ncbi:MAG: carboxypeptidase regulatory-like domain-containing protein, partial [Acidobacteria bacterium]|nr:carboxypeptidase regulatory-like domain-containing protein [Acidobacteriota bacterium]
MLKRSLACVSLVTALAVAASAGAFAQGSGGSISGTVVDSGGGSIPGAAVTVKNESGASFEAVTNGEGVFNVPAVAAGAYKVTVALAGFKTAVADVAVQLNTPSTVKVVLEVGQVSETVNVASSSELINTQTPVVAATLNADQLNRMPTASRNALNAVTFLPGINTPGTNRDSTINGLPESFVQITMDGVSNNDNFLRSSDSFFASVSPRQDAVEAVTVVLASGGANVGGSGAISINFQTRSGTNQFSGTAYEYMRRPSFNSNNWLNERNNEPKNDVKLDQYGGRVAGPIVIPGLYNGRGKAFYMLNYEQLRFPNSFTRSRLILHPASLNGTFRYLVGTEVREVNVLKLAADAGQTSAIDPTVLGLLQRIQDSTTTTGLVSQNSDPRTQTYNWQSPGKLFEHQPTLRIDYNVGENHRLSGSFAQIWVTRDPDYLNSADVRFPGASNFNLFKSSRPLYSAALRSTLSQSLVNELRLGITAAHGSSNFGTPSSTGPQSFMDQGGYAIDFDPTTPAASSLTNWHNSSSISWRASPTYELSNSLTWQRGQHSVNFGGSLLHVTAWENAQTFVPGIQLGFDTTSDPAAPVFATNALIPGASATQLGEARELYGLLTGRVTSVTGQAALDPETNKYVAFGPRRREGAINMTSLFAQDSWRMTPTFTLNYGLRWEAQIQPSLITPISDLLYQPFIGQT